MGIMSVTDDLLDLLLGQIEPVRAFVCRGVTGNVVLAGTKLWTLTVEIGKSRAVVLDVLDQPLLEDLCGGLQYRRRRSGQPQAINLARQDSLEQVLAAPAKYAVANSEAAC